MSPDDHYADLKRVIAAAGGKARRINVIMPFLYESRQHKRTEENLLTVRYTSGLTDMGVENIITFDAHDPRVHNALLLRDLNLYHAHTSLSSISFLMWTTLHRQRAYDGYQPG